MAKALTPRNRTNATARQGTEGDQLSEKSPSPEEAAVYIAEFTAELSYLARRAKLDLLVYLLDMARLEASRVMDDSKNAR
jgi:hypothetical protein